MYGDEEEQEGPKSSFDTYFAEGDVLFKKGEFKKALESYSLVIQQLIECVSCFDWNYNKLVHQFK